MPLGSSVYLKKTQRVTAILLRKCAKDIVSRTRALMNQNRLAPSVRNARHLAVSRGRRQTNAKRRTYLRSRSLYSITHPNAKW